MLPSILAAARVIGGTPVSQGPRAAISGKLADIGAKIRRNAPGEIFNLAGGNQIPLVSNIFNRLNDRRIYRIDRNREIRNAKNIVQDQPQRKLEESKFEREQKRFIQKEEASLKAFAHASANDRAVQTSQREETNNFLERISNDIAQLKDYIFKNGIGRALQADRSMSGIFDTLATRIPFPVGLDKVVKVITGINSKAIDLVRAGNNKIIQTAKSVAPKIGTLIESAKGTAKNTINGLRAGALNVLTKGSGILTSAGEVASGLLKGSGAIGRIAGTVGRILGPIAVVDAGMTGFEIGSLLNKKLEGTKIGEAKDRFFDSIFSAADRITNGAISGIPKKTIPATPVAGPGTIAYPGQVTIPSAFTPKQKADEIRARAEQQKFQRIEQYRFEQSEKTGRDLIDAISANTKATSDTVEPLKTISDPDWLRNITGFVSSVASRIGGFVSEKASQVGEAIRSSAPGRAIARVSKEIGQSFDRILGSTSRKFESGRGGPATISSGRGDLGGKSYGTYQLTGKALEDFVTKGEFADQFKFLKIKSDEFDERWRELAAKFPEQFGNAQHEFVKQTHFIPQQEFLKRSGIDLSSRGPAVQDAIWSTAVQFGGNTDVIKNALSGKDLTKMSDADIVSAIQDYKIRNNDKLFRSSSAAVRAGTLSRARKEKADLLSIANDPELTRVKQTFTQVTPTDTPTAPLMSRSGVEKLETLSQTNVGDIVGEQTIETKRAEQQVTQPIVIASGTSQSAPVSVPQSGGTTNIGSAPMVTRNQDSSIRRVTDGMMSYGIT